MSRGVHFGYNPPASQRNLEQVDPRTFVSDLERLLGIAGDALDSVWVSDHIMSDERFRLECWTLLTWIAARHPELSIGPIVAAVGYRHAPLLAKMVASLDALMTSAADAAGAAAGRPMLGYGAGWAEEEYRGYGYEFPRAADRIDQLDEALTVTNLLWDGGPVSFEGRWYRLVDATCVPVPQPHPLIMVGGEGPRTMAVAVRHADWWNTLHRPPQRRRATLERLDELCAASGRQPHSLRRSMYLTVYLDRDARIARKRAGHRLEGEAPPFAGDPTGLVDHLSGLVEEGIDAFQLVFAGWPDGTDLDLFVEHVRPAFPRG